MVGATPCVQNSYFMEHFTPGVVNRSTAYRKDIGGKGQLFARSTVLLHLAYSTSLCSAAATKEANAMCAGAGIDDCASQRLGSSPGTATVTVVQFISGATGEFVCGMLDKEGISCPPFAIPCSQAHIRDSAPRYCNRGGGDPHLYHNYRHQVLKPLQDTLVSRPPCSLT